MIREAKIIKELCCFLKNTENMVCVQKSRFKGFECDILGVLPESLCIEYEIKSHYTQIIQELTKKKGDISKHKTNRCNYFYFVLPYTDNKRAIEIINKRCPKKYGVIFYKINRLKTTFYYHKDANILHAKQMIASDYYEVLRMCVTSQHSLYSRLDYVRRAFKRNADKEWESFKLKHLTKSKS